MKKTAALVVALATFFQWTAVFAADAIGTLTYVEGRVDRTQEGSFDYAPVVRDEPVSEGDVIRTKSHSRAEIRFADGSSVRIAENSQLRVQDYAIGPDGKREKSHLFVDRGKVRAIVAKAANKQPNFLIDTPNMRGAIRGSDIVVGYGSAMTNLMSFEGQIEAQSVAFPDNTVVVTPGTTAALGETTAPTPPRKALAIEQKKLDAETGFFAAPSPAERSKAIIGSYSGDVRVKQKGAREWHRAALKETLGAGDQIETGANGTARVVLESSRIVNMKSSAHLEIEQLKVDPKTGAREDVLVATSGEFLFNIQPNTLSGPSTFKVKTPVSVASVRGTLMFLDILKAHTKAYFEQGHGSLMSLIDKVEKDVNDGEYAAVDNLGNFWGPNVPTDEERQRFRSGWESNSMYSYSPPGGQTPPASFDGAPDDGDADVPDDDGSGRNPVDIIQQNVNLQTFIAAITFTGVTSGVFFDFDYFSDFFEGEGNEGEDFGESKGLLAGAGDLWAATSQAVPVHFFGEFEGGFSNEPQVFLNVFTSYNEAQDTFETSDGGAFVGFASGRWDGERTAGNARGFYVDPDGTLGLLSGSFEDGNEQLFGDDTGLWRLDGEFLVTPMSQIDDFTGFNEEFDFEQLFDEFNVSFGEGIFETRYGSEYIDLFFIAFGVDGEENEDNRDWGIWFGFLEGEFDQPADGAMRRPIVGIVEDEESRNQGEDPTIFLGVIRGDLQTVETGPYEDEGTFDAQFGGVWVSEESCDSFTAGTLDGDFAGSFTRQTIEGSEVDFHAAGVGDYATMTELDPEQVGYTMDQLGDFIDQPITETHSGILSAIAGDIQGTMNASFLANSATDTGGIWTAIFNGTFTSLPDTTWSFAGDGIAATLNVTSFEGNQWLANVVDGTGVPGGFSGQAGGTFSIGDDGPGTLTGVGTGVWGTGLPCSQCD